MKAAHAPGAGAGCGGQQPSTRLILLRCLRELWRRPVLASRQRTPDTLSIAKVPSSHPAALGLPPGVCSDAVNLHPCLAGDGTDMSRLGDYARYPCPGGGPVAETATCYRRAELAAARTSSKWPAISARGVAGSRGWSTGRPRSSTGMPQSLRLVASRMHIPLRGNR